MKERGGRRRTSPEGDHHRTTAHCGGPSPPRAGPGSLPPAGSRLRETDQPSAPCRTAQYRCCVPSPWCPGGARCWRAADERPQGPRGRPSRTARGPPVVGSRVPAGVGDGTLAGVRCAVPRRGSPGERRGSQRARGVAGRGVPGGVRGGGRCGSAGAATRRWRRRAEPDAVGRRGRVAGIATCATGTCSGPAAPPTAGAQRERPAGGDADERVLRGCHQFNFRGLRGRAARYATDEPMQDTHAGVGDAERLRRACAASTARRATPAVTSPDGRSHRATASGRRRPAPARRRAVETRRAPRGNGDGGAGGGAAGTGSGTRFPPATASARGCARFDGDEAHATVAMARVRPGARARDPHGRAVFVRPQSNDARGAAGVGRSRHRAEIPRPRRAAALVPDHLSCPRPAAAARLPATRARTAIAEGTLDLPWSPAMKVRYHFDRPLLALSPCPAAAPRAGGDRGLRAPDAAPEPGSPPPFGRRPPPRAAGCAHPRRRGRRRSATRTTGERIQHFARRALRRVVPRPLARGGDAAALRDRRGAQPALPWRERRATA